MDDESIQIEDNKGKKDATLSADLDLVGSNFFSVHPKQDSLQFLAPLARFSLKYKTIYCEKVEYLDVADARIFPDSMKLVIRKNAKMEPLRNSKVVANYITKYHNFSNCNIEVTARKAYSGSGDYPYYDMDSNLTVIHMNEIQLDKSLQTTAKGNVASASNFHLSKQFDYYGEVAIKAANPLIFFNGATRINHNCEKFERNWMSFSAQIDPKNIQIPVDPKMTNLEGEAISAGIVWRDSPMNDSIRIYPTFLSSLVNENDPIVMSASGLLQYNFSSKEFQIGSKDKLLNRAEKGNFLALHAESCSMNGDGVVNLGMDYGDVIIDAVGVVNYDQEKGQTTMNLTTRFKMDLDKGLMEDVADRINAIETLKPMDFKSTTLEQAIVEWVDVKTADKIKSDFTIKGEVKRLPSELETTFTLSGLRLSSYESSRMQERGLVTSLNDAVLVNIYGKPVMKYIPVKAFFNQLYSGGVSGDKFGLLFDLPAGQNYFFDYTMIKKDGEMRIITGDKEFDSGLTSMKDEKRKTRNFRYELTTQGAYLNKFMRFFD
jgi:hypothetical protein